MTLMTPTTPGGVRVTRQNAPHRTNQPRTTAGAARVDRHTADPRAVAALVDSAIAQGFPATIDDPAVLRRFGAALLGRVDSEVAA